MKLWKMMILAAMLLFSGVRGGAQVLPITAQWDYDLATPGLAGFRLYNNGMTIFDTTRMKTPLVLQADYDIPGGAYRLGVNGFTMTACDGKGVESPHSSKYMLIVGFVPNNDDSDGDGMPDWWEIQVKTDPFRDDSSEDADRDGVGNFAEFLLATRTISGRVADELGNPLSGIWVEAISASSGLSQAVPTDREGNYKLTVLRLGDYKVMTHGAGDYSGAFYNNAASWAEAVVVDVSQAGASHIDFVLKKGKSISGVIRNLAVGDSLLVEVWSESAKMWGGAMVKGTGNEISFMIKGLPVASDYRLSISAKGYKNGYLMRDPAGIDSYKKGVDNIGPWQESAFISAGQSAIVVQLAKGKKISGSISGLNAGEKAWVEAWSDESAYWMGTSVTMGAAGGEAFTISGLIDARDYRVHAQSPGYLSGWFGGKSGESALNPVGLDRATLLNNSDMDGGLDGDIEGVHISMTRGVSMSGTIFGLDAAEHVYIVAWSEKANHMAGTRLAGLGGAADPYVLNGLRAANDYVVSVWSASRGNGFYCAANMCSAREAEHIDTSGGNVQGIDFTLSKGYSIAGVVRNLDAGEEAFIEAWSDTAWSWGATRIIGSGSDMPYTITGLAGSGDFTVTVTPKLHQTSVYPAAVNSATNPGDIHFTLADGRNISGRIASALPGECVFLEAWSPSSGYPRQGFVTADLNGAASYTISGLGGYHDYVVSAKTRKIHLFYSQSSAAQQAMRVNLEFGDAVEKNFDMAGLATGIISGVIAGLDSETHATVRIDIWDEKTGSWSGTTQKGNGEFAIEVPSGAYKIGMYASGYADTYYKGDNAVTTSTADAGTVVVGPAGAALGTMTLSKGFKVSGYVYHDRNMDGTGQLNEALGGVTVEIIGEGVSKSKESNADGSYIVEGLPPGEYTIGATSAHGIWRQSVSVANSDVVRTILLGNGSHASLAGTMTLNGSPVSGGIVLIFVEKGNFVNAVKTNETGKYFYGGLEAGKYTIRADVDADFIYEAMETLTFSAGETKIHNLVVTR